MDDFPCEADHVQYAYVCTTCESGYVCKKCIWKFDPCGSAFEKDMEDVKDIIKCPCCRQLNWKYHFNQIIQTTLYYDLTHYDDKHHIPALKLYYHNHENY